MSLENEQAEAGRDGRTRLARPNSQARTGIDREIFILHVQLTTSRIGNLTRLIHHALLYICDGDTYSLGDIFIAATVLIALCYHPLSVRLMRARAYSKRALGRPGKYNKSGS